MKDSQLWDDMLKGNKKSLEIIYRMHIHVLYDYGRKFSNDTGLVEDCIQNIFIDIWNKREKLGRTNHIKSYLMLALKRRIFRSQSKLKKINLIESNDNLNFDLTLSKEDMIIQLENEIELHAKLKIALDKLSKKHKEILYLKYQQNLDNKAIAKLLDINYQSVRNSLHRAINRLKNNMLFLFIF